MMNNTPLLNVTAGRARRNDMTADTILLVLEVSVVPVIVFGNLLIIIAVLRFKHLRYTSNIMVISLAVGDLLMGAVYMPLKILLKQRTDLFLTRISCLSNVFFSYFCVSLAMMFLSMISIERFYAVQFPFHYHSNMTITRSLIWSFLVFVMALLVALPSVCGIDTWSEGKFCFTSNVLPGYYVWSVVSVLFFISFFGFLSFLRVMAAEISMRWRDHAREVNESRNQDSVKSTLMLIVYVFSIICWLPQLAYIFIIVFNPRRATIVGLRSVSFLGVCSSGVNCFIYGIKNSQFKAAFKKIFHCKTSSVDPSLTIEVVTRESVA